MAKHEYPPLSDFPGDFTMVDREYDPRLKVKVRFARTKAVVLWFRDKVLASVIISILSLIAAFFLVKWLNTTPPQTLSTTTPPSPSHKVSGS